MKTKFLIVFFLTGSFSCGNSQNPTQSSGTLLGGPCEGCEAVFEFGNKKLSPVDTLPDFNDTGPRLKVTGTIYQNDGVTPAPDVILYIYHTDQTGIYPTKGDETGWARRHGYIRGWVKTGADGKYTFFTLKPGQYPGGGNPAHIHPTILEPDGRYYWVAEYLFKGDKYLTESEISPESPYGGQGLLSLRKENDILVAERDIILGKNVPNYN
jgi:protocatechuate 3,4-dioxygenase beta subunit